MRTSRTMSCTHRARRRQRTISAFGGASLSHMSGERAPRMLSPTSFRLRCVVRCGGGSCQVIFPELDASDWRDSEIARAEEEQLAKGKAFNKCIKTPSTEGGIGRLGAPGEHQPQQPFGGAGQTQTSEVALAAAVPLPALKEGGAQKDTDESVRVTTWTSLPIA